MFFKKNSAPAPQGQQLVEIIPANQGSKLPPIDVKSENIKSVVTYGERIDGNLTFQNGLKLDGEIHGDIEFGLTDGMMVVDTRALVIGNISGPRAIIVGEVRGNVMVSGRLVVMPSARVMGDLTAGSIQIFEGAQIDGRVRSINDMSRQSGVVQLGGTAAA